MRSEVETVLVVEAVAVYNLVMKNLDGLAWLMYFRGGFTIMDHSKTAFLCSIGAVTMKNKTTRDEK